MWHLCVVSWLLNSLVLSVSVLGGPKISSITLYDLGSHISLPLVVSDLSRFKGTEHSLMGEMSLSQCKKNMIMRDCLMLSWEI